MNSAFKSLNLFKQVVGEDGGLLPSENLADLDDKAEARTNLGVYSKSEADAADALNLKKAANLSDLANAATARTNLSVYSKTETDAVVANAVLGKENVGRFFFVNSANQTLLSSRAGYNIQPPCSLVFTTSQLSGSAFRLLGCRIACSTNGTPSVGVWDSEALDYISLQTTRADRYFIGVVFLPNGTVKIVANDSASTPASLTFSTSDASFGVESEYATGEFSRLAVFDFDITAQGAPYTFADYRAGKDVPYSIRGRYAYSTDPTMGASTSAWNITTPPEEYANVRNGDWTAGPSVVYLKNRTSDLPDGETYAIDYAANGAVYDIMNDTFLENLYSKLIYDTGAKKYRVKFKYKWNKLASVHDDVYFGVYLTMTWVDQIELLRINSPDTPDGQWHEYDQVIDVNDYMGLNVPALFVSPTSSPNYGDYAISLAGFSITSASDALFISADALSGNQIRDISGNNNHLNKNTSYDEHLNAFSAEKDLNPAAASFDIVSLDLTKTAGEPIGGNSSVVPARGGKLCTLNLRSDKAATFKIGTATTTAKYGTLTFSAANTWQTLRFTSYGDDQVYITRNAAGTGKATFIATINYEDIIG